MCLECVDEGLKDTSTVYIVEVVYFYKAQFLSAYTLFR